METAFMKLLRVIGTTGLFLLVGTTAAAYAPQDRPEQDKQDEKAKPAKQDEKAKPAKQEQNDKSAKQDEKAKPAQQDERAKPAKQEARQAKPEQQDRPARQEAKQARPEQQDRPAQQQDRQSAQQSQRDGENRGGGDHGRISDEHYRTSFGREHNFHVNQRDYDSRRFEYGGYSFGFIDPWPVAWYYTDDVYVVYDNGGYYMYNPAHPGIRISVNIL
jgi:hypothetical protein